MVSTRLVDVDDDGRHALSNKIAQLDCMAILVQVRTKATVSRSILKEGTQILL